MPVQQLHSSVYRIPVPYTGGGLVYIYLVKADQVALIDTGVTGAADRVIVPALAEIGMAPTNVDLVINTHGHLDHSGGNAAFKRLAPGTRICIHPADAEMATNLELEVEFHTKPLRALDLPPSYVAARATYVSQTAGAEKVAVDRSIADGETLDLGRGVALRVVHVPGHTPGHVALWWEREGVVFTADSVQGQGGRPGGYPYYFDAPNYRRSLQRLIQLDCRVLCAGHPYVGGSHTSDATRTGEDVPAFLRESARVADAIHARVAAAVQRMPDASEQQIALAALDDLLYDLPQQRLRETQMPWHGPAPLHAHIVAARESSYPDFA